MYVLKCIYYVQQKNKILNFFFVLFSRYDLEMLEMGKQCLQMQKLWMGKVYTKKLAW